jgi:hypothetical protein
MVSDDEREVVRAALNEAIALTQELDPAVRPALCGVVAEYLLRPQRPSSLSFDEHVSDREGPTGDESASVALTRAQGRSQVVQIAVIVAWFWQTHQRAANVADVRAAYGAARIPPPGNISESFARTVRKGWITGGDGAYRITQQGLQAIRAFENE